MRECGPLCGVETNQLPKKTSRGWGVSQVERCYKNTVQCQRTISEETDIDSKGSWMWSQFSRQCSYAVWSVSPGGRAASGSVCLKERERGAWLLMCGANTGSITGWSSLLSLHQPGRNTIKYLILYYVVQKKSYNCIQKLHCAQNESAVVLTI